MIFWVVGFFVGSLVLGLTPPPPPPPNPQYKTKSRSHSSGGGGGGWGRQRGRKGSRFLRGQQKGGKTDLCSRLRRKSGGEGVDTIEVDKAPEKCTEWQYHKGPAL